MILNRSNTPCALGKDMIKAGLEAKNSLCGAFRSAFLNSDSSNPKISRFTGSELALTDEELTSDDCLGVQKLSA